MSIEKPENHHDTLGIPLNFVRNTSMSLNNCMSIRTIAEYYVCKTIPFCLFLICFDELNCKSLTEWFRPVKSTPKQGLDIT